LILALPLPLPLPLLVIHSGGGDAGGRGVKLLNGAVVGLRVGLHVGRAFGGHVGRAFGGGKLGGRGVKLLDGRCRPPINKPAAIGCRGTRRGGSTCSGKASAASSSSGKAAAAASSADARSQRKAASIKRLRRSTMAASSILAARSARGRAANKNGLSQDGYGRVGPLEGPGSVWGAAGGLPTRPMRTQALHGPKGPDSGHPVPDLGVPGPARDPKTRTPDQIWELGVIVLAASALGTISLGDFMWSPGTQEMDLKRFGIAAVSSAGRHCRRRPPTRLGGGSPPSFSSDPWTRAIQLTPVSGHIRKLTLRFLFFTVSGRFPAKVGPGPGLCRLGLSG
jgi:hypothetical protein